MSTASPPVTPAPRHDAQDVAFRLSLRMRRVSLQLRRRARHDGQRSIERLQFEAGANSHAFAIYAAVMAAFFCISFPLTRLAIFLERRLAA
jgi:hypothetical protein